MSEVPEKQGDLEVIDPEIAQIDGLAERLHWKMEHLDPSEGPEWGGLSDRDKEFYRACIRALLCERSLLEGALRSTLRQSHR